MTRQQERKNAWARVRESARQYDLLKSKGIILDNDGCLNLVSHDNIQTRERTFLDNLLYDIKMACILDFLVGAALEEDDEV